MQPSRKVHAGIVALATALITACGTPGAPLPPSLELANPVSDLRAVRKGDKVYLAWTVPTQTTDRQNIRHPGKTSVCRNTAAVMVTCGTLVGDVPPAQLPQITAKKVGDASKPQAMFIDTLPKALEEQNPLDQVSYAISVMNANGRSAGFSNRVQVPAAPTLPPPSDLKVQLNAGGVTLAWNGSSETQSTGLSHFYRAYRKEEGSGTETEIGAAPFTASALADPTFQWDKTYDYRVTVVTIVLKDGHESQIEGDDTPLVRIVTADVFPPAVPTGLQAVASGVGQQPFIDLIWSPDSEADLAGYNVYRHEEGEAPVKINSQTVSTPAYRDSAVASGKKYFYSVSAVDLRGNESARSEEASETMP
jgi:fibronectin type 3 domain-containing protein